MHEQPDDQILYPPMDKKPRRVLLTSGQLLFVAGSFLVVVALFVVETVVDFDYARLLWAHPMGQKMLAVGVGTYAAGMSIYVLGSVLINLVLPPRDERFRVPRSILSCLLVALFLVVFWAPLMFVILVGPTSIEIMENVAR